MLHGLTPFDSPAQFVPPKAGLGLVQDRWRIWRPPPHFLLQADKFFQSDQPPSTKMTRINRWHFITLVSIRFNQFFYFNPNEYELKYKSCILNLTYKPLTLTDKRFCRRAPINLPPATITRYNVNTVTASWLLRCPKFLQFCCVPRWTIRPGEGAFSLPVVASYPGLLVTSQLVDEPVLLWGGYRSQVSVVTGTFLLSPPPGNLHCRFI